jgi:hypothetical protein
MDYNSPLPPSNLHEFVSQHPLFVALFSIGSLAVIAWIIVTTVKEKSSKGN